MVTLISSSPQFTGKLKKKKLWITLAVEYLLHACFYTLAYYSDAYTKTPKMDPSQLDVFKTVREITGKKNQQTTVVSKDFHN